MKGKARFNRSEANEIRSLLRRVRTTDRDEQKRLRNRLRRLDFYISDWSGSPEGFTRSDFDALVEDRLIEVTDSTADEPSVPLETTDETAGARDRRARAAARYRPERVELLLVAEAPPADGERYFYFDNVAEHDSLFRYVVRGVLGREPTRTDKAARLDELKARGVFLIDLKPDPVDATPLSDYVDTLIARAGALKPRKVILIKATVYDAAFRTMVDAGLPVADERIPFPGSGRQRQFEEAFARALKSKPAAARL